MNLRSSAYGAMRLQFGAECADQRSTGEDLLTGKPFSTSQYGIKADWRSAPRC